MAMVDITGLDKMLVLEALWKAQASASFFRFQGMAPPSFDIDKAREDFQSTGGAFDYCCGRAIKANLGTDMVDPAEYDRSAGQGTMVRVIAALRSGKKPVVGPDRFYCIGSKAGDQFEPFGGPMLDGKADTVMCAHCGQPKKSHASRK
jgi:hypothetical protein